MQTYANLSGDSGVRAYAAARDSITIEFVDGATYRYDARRPGRVHVQEMQRLARAGAGLSAYISQHVRENFAKRLR